MPKCPLNADKTRARANYTYCGVTVLVQAADIFMYIFSRLSYFFFPRAHPYTSNRFVLIVVLVNLITLFLGRLTPPKRLTTTSCTFFRQ